MTDLQERKPRHALTNFELDLSSAQVIKLELVVPLLQLQSAQLPVTIVDNSHQICLPLGHEHDAADGILDRQRLRLTLRIRAAIAIDGERVVPERSLDVLPVGRHHVVRRRLAVVPRFCERLQHLLVSLVVVVLVPALSFHIVGVRLVPDVPDIVALRGVVPRLDFNHIRLILKQLWHAQFEVLFAAAIPVLARVVLEEQRGETRDADLALGVGNGLLPHAVVGRLVIGLDVAGTLRGPRVPPKDAVVRGVRAEEVRVGRVAEHAGHEEDVAAYIALELRDLAVVELLAAKGADELLSVV